MEGPASITIRPRGPVDATLSVPGSKSITNRALPVAALARGTSRLRGALQSDDTQAMCGCLEALGVRLRPEPDGWVVSGTGGCLLPPKLELDARASGTTARFVTALATLAPGPSRIDGTPRMRERPIEDLARTLGELGARVLARGPDGCPPVDVAGGGLPGGAAQIDASRSSQFVTALLLVAPYAENDVQLTLEGGVLVSRPYVELSLQVMRAFGADAGWKDEHTLLVRAGQGYVARDYTIEPDASAAAYPFAAAAITGGRVRVRGIPRDSIQADLLLLGVLERMGCQVRRGEDFVEVTGPTEGLRGVDVDMNDMSDGALAIAVVALFATGRSMIRNVGHIRLKETDRLAALERELCKLGAHAKAGPDSLCIDPAPLRGAEIATYDDHRMAMAFSLAGLRVPGVSIVDPSCVAKTWPDYFAALERL